MIPEAAVDAAVEAFVGAKGTLNDHILAILEAGAPHIIAAALEEAAVPHMLAQATIVDQTVELVDIIRDGDSELAKAEAVIAAGYRKVEKCGQGATPVTPEATVDHPTRDTCPDCGGDGSSPARMCTCPGWVAVEDLAFADLKGLLAGSGLSFTKGTP